ncbi:MAG: thiamine ABC transporter substrate binding subunit [Candidatus Saccharibacteria bacterium]|nr:thiamine ABC transporter substrate binding subunit [Pseudorhodobacter sp.]
MKSFHLALALLPLATMATAQTPVLNVLTYDSFTAEWGPGPAIEKGFEATCGCDLKFTATGDAAAMLARLKLEGASSTADVVVGLDTSLTEAARQSGLIAPHGLALANDLPVPFVDPDFIPFDWGWFAFVYDNTKLANPPKSFVELAASDLKVVIEDPRSSTPGLGLLMWIKAAYGDKSATIWQDLSDNILTVTPSWDQAYGLFLKGEADMVLSYTTSPAYHLIAEKDATKSAAPFSEGHYMQVEVAAMLKSSQNPDLAKAFLTYLGGDEAQATLPETNWMYPAKTPAAGLPAGFETLIKPAKSLLFSSVEAEAQRQAAVDEWQTILAR